MAVIIFFTPERFKKN